MLSADERKRTQLERFLYRADELAGTRLVKHGTKATFSINYDYRAGTIFSLTEPDGEELKACLMTLRQFVLRKESIFIDKIYNLCEKTLVNTQVKGQLREAREAWKASQKSSGIRVVFDDRDITPAYVAGLLFNARYFHNDEKKEAELARLGPVESLLAKHVFLSYVADTIRQVFYMADIIRVGLSKDWFTFDYEECHMKRDEAWEILCEYTKAEALRKHGLAVEAAMRAYARKYGEDEEMWGCVGLLHDFDYEMHPNAEEHPKKGAPILRERGVPEEIVHAVLCHAFYLEDLGVVRENNMDRAIFAVDELSGFIIAVALVRPSKSIHEVDVAAVKKKMKDKGFARAVRREDITDGAAVLGVDLDEHIAFVIEALKPVAETLGIAGAV
jgi:putative nucleotidyltransferase with HDIG domain